MRRVCLYTDEGASFGAPRSALSAVGRLRRANPPAADVARGIGGVVAGGLVLAAVAAIAAQRGKARAEVLARLKSDEAAATERQELEAHDRKELERRGFQEAQRLLREKVAADAKAEKLRLEKLDAEHKKDLEERDARNKKEEETRIAGEQTRIAEDQRRAVEKARIAAAAGQASNDAMAAKAQKVADDAAAEADNALRAVFDATRRVPTFASLEGATRTPIAYASIGQNAAVTVLRLDGALAIEKRPLGSNTDSMIYEYLAGLCVNELRAYYPIFPQTYALGDAGTAVPDAVAEYTKDRSAASLRALVAWGCTNSAEHKPTARLLMQYLPIAMNLASLVERVVAFYTDPRNAREYGVLYELTTVLHILYAVLSSVADSLTHFDLHAKNVGLVAMPPGTFLEFTLLDPEHGDVTYKTQYMPVVYDFGASVFGVTSLVRGLHTSAEVMRAVCAADDSSGGPCRRTCGDGRGYRDEPGRSRVKRNVSADTRAMYYVETQLREGRTFERLADAPAFVGQLSTFLPKFNMPHTKDLYEREDTSRDTSTRVSNVHAAFDVLHAVVCEPAFLAGNDAVYAGKRAYEQLRVSYGMRAPFSTARVPAPPG
jgi:hypothetical protein